MYILYDSNMHDHEAFYYQVRIEGKRIVKQRRQGNASRRWYVRHIHGHRNGDTMLADRRSYVTEYLAAYLFRCNCL